MVEPPLASAGLRTLAPDHGARSGQGSKAVAGGERVFALVLDGEHDVVGLIGQARPSSLFPLLFYSPVE
jgi:hypothetical protein